MDTAAIALLMGISVPYYFANGGSEAVRATFIDAGTRRERGLEPQEPFTEPS
ncbi:hypothetical protein [Stieleria sedimenti]|uniref:hypothetical protein n=1 Tax=Stieleria sedimenti TaxID=2976331 RepID=UPI002180449D|nr:hypothetical protein [Stieleria sedimenti]